ncbi:MAG: hypothetical protein ABIT20_01120 [Gemmatimonadaceae bacterium]
MMNRFSHLSRRRAGFALVAVAGLSMAACSSFTDSLLQATDPDIINPADVQSADGAEAIRIGALARLTTMTASAPANTEGVWFMGGLLADEWKSGDTFVQRDETDKRTIAVDNSIVTAGYRYIHRSRISANQAIDLLRKYKPAPASNIGQMYFVRGYAELLSAENFCNGQPFSDGSTGDVLEGAPLSVADAFARAIVSADSGLAAVGGATDAASLKIAYSLKVTKARALMGLGGATNYAAARTTLAGIPTSFTFDVTFLQVSGDNGIWALNNSAKRYVVGDSIDQNGLLKNSLPFVSAKDPRVPTSGTGKAFDSTTPFAQQLLWASAGNPVGREDPVAVVNGIDARLVEAEVQLSQGDVPGWLATLNTLRAGPTQLSQSVRVTGLAPLTDPGSTAARVDLQFREKAFWTFGRGERLGDLRRLIRQYSRTQDTVFPTGIFPKGGTYGTDVNLPVPQAEQNNTKFTVCTDRAA